MNEIMVGKHGITWNSGKTGDNAIWDIYKLKCWGRLRATSHKWRQEECHLSSLGAQFVGGK
jgi:hypothetical protein